MSCFLTLSRRLKRSKLPFQCNLSTTNILTPETLDASTSSGKVSGFAKAYEKQSRILEETSGPAPTFASLLRNSKLIDVSTVLKAFDFYMFRLSIKSTRASVCV